MTHQANSAKNPGGFFPYGVSGVFNGAAMVYLSYIGYDAVSTMAEEVKNPTREIPIGISGSVVLVTVVSLFLVGLGFLAQRQVDTMKDYWYDRVQVSIFLCGEVSTAASCAARSTSPPGRSVNEQPDSIRRTDRCRVAGSGTYCRIR